MASLPEGMKTGKQPPDQDFDDGEQLFRAFREQDLEGDSVAIDAIELPDMSVNRGKYGTAWWLLHLDRWEGCGVVAFEVRDARFAFLHSGVTEYRFDVVHTPTQNNYPHSDVRAYENERHIKSPEPTDIEPPEQIDPTVHLRWRNRLRQRLRVVIRPGEYIAPE